MYKIVHGVLAYDDMYDTESPQPISIYNTVTVYIVLAELKLSWEGWNTRYSTTHI